MSQVAEIKCVQVNEARRVYVFPNGRDLMLENVVSVEILPSNKHVVKTQDGRKVVVSHEWLWFEVEEE